MSNTKGFITVATGGYYCRLAENLAMSYRLFSDNKYPFYAITDRKGAKRLKKYFDGVVVLDEPHYTFLDKMEIARYTPFDRTVFIDADADIVSDISFLMDDFERNGSALSCIGSLIPIGDERRPVHFDGRAVEHFGIDHFVAFNGGVYYFRKCDELTSCIDFIFDDLIPHYRDYGLKEFRQGQMADEPLYGLAMVVRGFAPMSNGRNTMMLLQDIKSLSWDMEQRTCRHIWYGKEVSPVILHYGTHNTYTRKYVYYNTVVRCRYRRVPAVFRPFCIAAGETALLFRHMGRKDDRKAFMSWFKAHFSAKFFKRLFSRVGSLFKRS